METIPLLGFLTVIDHPRSGFIGGLLVLNPVGRPVEFHCTASLRPNRAQEILFGNALEPYLFGEQIAQALVRKAQAKISFFFTDSPGVLALQDFVEQPLIFVPQSELVNEPSVSEMPAEEGSEKQHLPDNRDLFSFSTKKNNVKRRFEPLRSIPGLSVHRWKETQIANMPLWIPDDRNLAISAVVEKLNDYTRSIDFGEPFSRIRLALDEAQKAA